MYKIMLALVCISGSTTVSLAQDREITDYLSAAELADLLIGKCIVRMRKNDICYGKNGDYYVDGTIVGGYEFNKKHVFVAFKKGGVNMHTFVKVPDGTYRMKPYFRNNFFRDDEEIFTLRNLVE